VEYAVSTREGLMRFGALMLGICGDSTGDDTSDVIRNGGIVLADASTTNLAPGKVHLVEPPRQSLMVKRLERSNALRFMSDNPGNGSFPAEDAAWEVGQVYGSVGNGRVS